MSENYRIYILEMYSKTVPSRAIRFFSRHPYSHIAISMTPRCDIIYSFGRKRLDTILHGGFVEEHQTGPFFSRYHDTACRIAALDVSREQYERVERQLAYLKDHEAEYRYDYIGLLLRCLHIPVTFRNKYVCSYFVAALLQYAGVLNCPKDPYFMTPADFSLLPASEEIYVGVYTAFAGMKC